MRRDSAKCEHGNRPCSHPRFDFASHIYFQPAERRLANQANVGRAVPADALEVKSVTPREPCVDMYNTRHKLSADFFSDGGNFKMLPVRPSV
jgi:hypothetical protein